MAKKKKAVKKSLTYPNPHGPILQKQYLAERAGFVMLLGDLIRWEANSFSKYNTWKEPYRKAGEALVDEALRHIP